MKKHFLLLVMALVSLAGYAATDISTSTTINIITSNVTYGGDLNPTIVVRDGAYTMTLYHATTNPDGNYTWDGKFYTTSACTAQAKPEVGAAYAINELPAGEYWIQIEGVGVYTGKKAQSFTVNKRAVTIPAAALEKTYGDPDPAIALADLNWAEAVGFVNEPDYTNEGALDPTNPDDLLVINAAKVEYRSGLFDGTAISYTYEGSDGIADANEATPYPVTISGLTAANYTLSVAGGITIHQKAIAEAWFNKTLFTATYKGAAFAVADLGLTITDPRGTGTADDYVLTSDDYTVTLNGGTAVINANTTTNYTVKVEGAGNYKGTITLKNGDAKGLKVNKAPMSVAIANIPRPYKAAKYTADEINTYITGLDAAAKPFEYFGYVGSDVAGSTIAGLTAPTATAVADNKNVGLYAITWSQATSTNYDITQITTTEKAGKLSIEPKELTITAVSATKTVGAEDPALTYTIAGYATGEGVADAIETTPSFQRAPGETAGDYPISLLTAAVTKANYTVPEANYVVSEVNPETGAITNAIKFSITAAKPMLTILNQTKVYGAADPATIAAPVINENFIVTGLKAGDVSKLAGIEFERAPGEDVANYTITLKGTVDLGSDYEPLTVIPGSFSITAAPLAIVIQDQTVTLGTEAEVLAQLDPSLVAVTGIASFDEQDDVFTLSLGDGVVPGTADTYVDGIIFTPGAKAANYTYPDISTPAKLAPVAGNLIIVDPASTIVLNRAAKEDFEDTEKNNAATVIAAAAGNNKTVTFGDFEMAKDQWYSLTLPFATSVKEVSEAFGYAVVDIFDKESNLDNDVMFKLWMGDLPANEPFIVKIYQNKNMNTVTFAGKAIVAGEPTVTDVKGNQFIGTYEGKLGFEGGKQYVFSISSGKISRAGSSTYLRPLGAYIKTVNVMDGMSSAPRILIEEPDGTTTAISTVSVEQSQDAEGWYNLNGMKMNGAPSQKGVYIKNGKKVIVK